MFQLIPKVFDGVEVRALCRSAKFFHTNLDKPFLYGPRFLHRGNVIMKQESANSCHKVGSTEWSRMSLYAVALRFPFIRTKGPSPNHEKQHQTIIPPPPNSTVMMWPFLGIDRGIPLSRSLLHPGSVTSGRKFLGETLSPWPCRKRHMERTKDFTW